MVLAPSASAARILERESEIESETVQRFLAQHAGIVEDRGTAKRLHNLRTSFSKTVLVVDERSLAIERTEAGIVQGCDCSAILRAVLVVDEKQLGAVEAGKLFEQLRRAGMKTSVMDESLRQSRTRSEGDGHAAAPATVARQRLGHMSRTAGSTHASRTVGAVMRNPPSVPDS